jgi:hypothetical protein
MVNPEAAFFSSSSIPTGIPFVIILVLVKRNLYLAAQLIPQGYGESVSEGLRPSTASFSLSGAIEWVRP